MTEKNHTSILDLWLEQLPVQVRDTAKTLLSKTINYEPKIGVMGKSGSGKSSLVNAILGKEVCKTGSAGGCTRAFQEESINISGTTITFVDLPGISENKQHHIEYNALYKEKVKDLDLILWVIKVNDRANKDDEEFYEELIKFYDKERILFVLSQCDNIQPSREFNYITFEPSTNQLVAIEENRKRIYEDFKLDPENVLPIACNYYEGKFQNWNIESLIIRTIKAVPPESKSAIYKTVSSENKAPEAKSEAKGAFRTITESVIDTIIDTIPIPELIKKVIKQVKGKFLDFAGKIWDSIFD